MDGRGREKRGKEGKRRNWEEGKERGKEEDLKNLWFCSPGDFLAMPLNANCTNMENTSFPK